MISYCITVYDEVSYIKNLIETIHKAIKDDEEIVVVHTYKHTDEQNTDTYKEIETYLKSNNRITYKTFHFQDQFYKLKNYVNSFANKTYIVNLDADEILEPEFIDIIRKTIIENPEIELFYLPRINVVEGLTQEDVNKWSWKMNEYGWINWPDFQPRVYKNLPNILWQGDVHETLVGFNRYGFFPEHPKCAIMHFKTIDRQRSQNSFYDQINAQKQSYKKPVAIPSCRALIGMCSWNSPTMLKKCVESILTQIDLSQDMIAAVLNEGDLESIHYLHDKKIPFVFNSANTGPIGIDYLKPFIENSQYFINTNDDMIFHEGFVEDLISIIEEYYPCTASCGLVENFFSNNPPVIVDENLKDFNDKSIEIFLQRYRAQKYKRSNKIISYNHPIMTKSRDFLEIGGYSGNWDQDFLSGYGRDDVFPYLLWERSQCKYRFIVSDKSVVFHLSGATTKKLPRKYRQENHNQDKFVKISNGLSIQEWRQKINFGASIL